MSNPRDALRKLAEEESKGVAPSKPAPQDFAPQARAFISNTATPALELAKEQIIETMPGREGDVTETIGGASGGQARLVIRHQGKETNEYVTTIMATASAAGVKITLSSSPSLGLMGTPQFAARSVELRSANQPLDLEGVTVPELADQVIGNYAATVKMMRDAGIG